MQPRLIIKFAFLASVFVYAAVARIVSQQPLDTVPDPEFIRNFVRILAGVYAVSVLVVLPIMMARMPRNDNPASAQIRTMMKLAFMESGAIYGLILSMQTHNPSYSLYFGVPAFFLMLIFA